MSDKDPILDPSEFEIDFQDFSNTQVTDGPTIPVSQPKVKQTDYMFQVDSEGSEDDLIGNLEPPNTQQASSAGPTAAFWSFAFYKQFFDINDEIVLNRLLYSFLPVKDCYMDKLQPQPDMYGPFWVCMTLIFSTAISGNLADFLNSMGKDQDWAYDFKKVTIAATVVLLYVTVLPSLLCGYLWWRKSQLNLKLIDTLCLYGYSLTVFIPISILWCIDFELVRWGLVLIACGTSGTVLILSLWSVLQQEPRQIAMIITGVLAACHVLLVLLFKVYFFTSSSMPDTTPTVVVPPRT